MLTDDCLSIVLTKFSNVLDVHKWKSVSKGFNKLCTDAIKDKCKDRKKKFETNIELRDAVRKYYNIKYEPRRYRSVSYRGDEERRRKDAEYIACAYGWNMNEWDVSQVKYFMLIFRGLHLFNEPIGSWITSNATDMSWMFTDARSFNQDISSWDTSSVKRTYRMFNNATSFNQPLPWDVSSVINMHFMFHNASSFNQPTTIGRWDVSRNDEFHKMFLGAESFDPRQLPWFRHEMIDAE